MFEFSRLYHLEHVVFKFLKAVCILSVADCARVEEEVSFPTHSAEKLLGFFDKSLSIVIL